MELVPLSQPLVSEDLLRLRDYWVDARGNKKMPSRDDIDPIDFPYILAHIAMVDVTYRPLQFRYRLIGTAITNTAGRDATGRVLDERLYGDRVESFVQPYRLAAEGEQPVATRRRTNNLFKDWVYVESLNLPLGEEGAPPNFVLAAMLQVTPKADIPPADTVYLLDWDDGTAGKAALG